MAVAIGLDHRHQPRLGLEALPQDLGIGTDGGWIHLHPGPLSLQARWTPALR
jgi:hypothetical protein